MSDRARHLSVVAAAIVIGAIVALLAYTRLSGHSEEQRIVTGILRGFTSGYGYAEEMSREFKVKLDGGSRVSVRVPRSTQFFKDAKVQLIERTTKAFAVKEHEFLGYGRE